jgi:subtilase family serine protease
MTLHHRPIAAVAAAMAGLAAAAGLSAFAPGAASAAPTLPAGYTALANSVPATTDPQTGTFTARSMAIQVALQPRDRAGLASALTAMYTKGSGRYHHWLAAGQFDARFAPPAARRRAVTRFLVRAGLKVEASASPFLVSADGSSAQVTAAFHTTLRTYKSKLGPSYFQNSTPAAVPSALAADVQGIIGLTNTIRDRMQVQRPARVRRPAGASCEAPYPTAAQQFASVNTGTPIPFGYGAGPGGSGLTPAQDNSV